MLLSKTVEVLFRGALASYLLLFALDIKTNSTRWASIIGQNLQPYSEYVGSSVFSRELVDVEWLNYYCQWLVLACLLIISGLRNGKVLAWLAVFANLWLCWSEL